jgi:hypothetical protein
MLKQVQGQKDMIFHKRLGTFPLKRTGFRPIEKAFWFFDGV